MKALARMAIAQPSAAWWHAREAQARRRPVGCGLFVSGGHRAGPTAETLKVWETLQGLERTLALLATVVFSPPAC